MRQFQSMGMSCNGSRLLILDQTLLPGKEQWLACDDVETLVGIIQRLAIRGAPAIGISASILLGLLAERGLSREQLLREAEVLRAARPTAVNLMNNIDQMKAKMQAAEYPLAVVAEAERIYLEDIELCERMATRGAALIRSGEQILTHCNTGGLATAGIGTAMGVIIKAHQQQKNISVWVDETRPLLQGARLTAWECGRFAIPHTIICDSTAAMLMKNGEVDRVFVGSDRIAANGDFANKIGTYSLAVLAKHHGVPFYVVAPRTTVDPECPSGDDIRIEQRAASEVQGVSGSFGACCWAPPNSQVYNPAFDVTPAALVTAWVLDSGLFTEEDLNQKDWWCGA